MLKDLIKIVSSEPEVQRLQDNLELFLRPLKEIPLLDGIMLEDIAVSGAADTTVNHLLGRKIRGYLITKQDASVTVFDKQASNPFPTKTLILRGSGTATISLWVF